MFSTGNPQSAACVLPCGESFRRLPSIRTGMIFAANSLNLSRRIFGRRSSSPRETWTKACKLSSGCETPPAGSGPAGVHGRFAATERVGSGSCARNRHEPRQRRRHCAASARGIARLHHARCGFPFHPGDQRRANTVGDTDSKGRPRRNDACSVAATHLAKDRGRARQRRSADTRADSV
jgi:hypothetical protein